jgi:hypothetical protein
MTPPAETVLRKPGTQTSKTYFFVIVVIYIVEKNKKVSDI